MPRMEEMHIQELANRVPGYSNHFHVHFVKRITTMVLKLESTVNIQQSLLSKLLAFDVDGPSPTQLRVLNEQLPVIGRSIRERANLPTTVPPISYGRNLQQVAGTSRPRPASPDIQLAKLSDKDIIKLISDRPSLSKQIHDLHRSEKEKKIPQKRKASEEKTITVTAPDVQNGETRKAKISKTPVSQRRLFGDLSDSDSDSSGSPASA